MLKTLLITTDFPPQIGGVSEYLSQICARLPQDKISVLTSKTTDTNRFDSQQQYKIYRKNIFIKNRLIWPKWILLLVHALRIVRKDRFKQILVGQILPVGTVALIINYIFKIPYVVSTHAMDITILATSNRKMWLAKKILARSTQIVTVSHYTKGKIIELGVVSNKIVIISPATDILDQKYTDYTKEMIEKYDLNGKKVLLTVGRIVERKGHLEVLKALLTIIKNTNNVRYLITSDGPYKPVLEKFVADNKLDNYVKFTGTIPRNELPSLYRISDIFIMPTRMLANNDVEGFGIVYLEANAFGKPVIAYNSGGVSDAVLHKKTGLLVEPKGPAGIAVNVLELLENEKYAVQLGETGRTRVKEEFNWEFKAKTFLNIL